MWGSFGKAFQFDASYPPKDRALCSYVHVDIEIQELHVDVYGIKAMRYCHPKNLTSSDSCRI